MATIRDIISAAQIKARVLASGENVSASDASADLFTLQSMLDSWRTTGKLGKVTPIVAEINITALAGQQVVKDGATTISLPKYDEDGKPFTYFKLIEIRDINTNARENWVYNPDLAKWSQMDNLTLNSENPFGDGLNRALISILALELSDSYGLSPSNELQKNASVGMSIIGSAFRDPNRKSTATFS